MRVGILTYHNTLNFGAALQAFALQRTCVDLGASVEIIDYRNALIEARRRAKIDVPRSLDPLGAMRRALNARFLRAKSRAFAQFEREHLLVGTPSFADPDEIRKGPPEYDLYLIGSDQVWNHEINGADPTYFAHFVRDRSKVATFASSFGMSSIPSHLLEFYADGLSSIARIGVREELAASLVRDITGSRAEVVADPVFLRSRAEWSRFAGNGRSSRRGWVSTYFLDHGTRGVGDQLLASGQLRSLRQLKLAGGIAMRDFVSPGVDVRPSRGPLEFLRAIQGAAFVLTDSFHATALAVIFDRPFGVILRGEAGKDARITGLLDKLDLRDRVVSAGSQLNFSAPSDSVVSGATLESIRDHSRQYLESLVAAE